MTFKAGKDTHKNIIV